jgi:hypothetical protein
MLQSLARRGPRAATGGHAMKRISLAALALALFSLSPAAGAQTATPFMTVDAVTVNGTAILVTGIVEGDSEPSTRSISFNLGTEAQKLWALESCHRSLLLALSKPGQYVAKATLNVCTVSLVTP